MEPKFQSSFIPKGPISTGAPTSGVTPRKERSILSLITLSVFSISVILALGAFGYKLFLNYRIDHLSSELDSARASLEPEVISEFTRLNDRIISTGNLLSSHRILTPLFDFLEDSTLKSVRFTEFKYLDSSKGIELVMAGQARGYSALALQADMFSKSDWLNDTVFSDLNLNEAGNVIFTMRSKVSPKLVSYEEDISRQAPVNLPPVPTTSTSTTSVSDLELIVPTSTPATTSTSSPNQ